MDVQQWLDWRGAQRRRRRVMTWSEYWTWAHSGDSISSCTESNPFPGGLTIKFSGPAVVGNFDDDSSST